MRELTEALIAFVRSDLLDGRDLPIDADTYLFDEGLVDSLGILRLIAFLELRIGRPIADSDVVMKHFRTIRTINERFGAAGRSDAAPDRLESRLEFDAAGGIRFHGAHGELFLWLDGQFERLAREAGARTVPSPPTLPRATLERAGYFEAFADVAIPAAGGGETFLPPAACYHVYAALQSARLAGAQLVTLAAHCGRRETRADDDAGRLRQFRMREVVFLGPPEWVSAERDAWMARTHDFAASIGLTGTMEPATDTFFGHPGRGRRLLQQVKNLKYELRMDGRQFGPLAVASFNLHETFFGSRFDIRMADGSVAASGCAAFGVERWTLARLAQHAD